MTNQPDETGKKSPATGAQTLLGFDYGEARVGVALGNTVAGTANPLTTIEYRSRAVLFGQVADLIGQWAPQSLVVGRPLTKSGDQARITGLAERFARRLAGRFGLPVALVDERYSSLAAQSEIAQTRSDPAFKGRSGSGASTRRPARAGPQHDDAVAAAVILRQYLHEQSAS